MLTLLNFEDDLVSLLEHQYDTALSRHPHPACWFLFLPSHEDHNLSSTYQHSLFFCGHDLLYLEMVPTESGGELRVQDGVHSVQPFYPSGLNFGGDQRKLPIYFFISDVFMPFYIQSFPEHSCVCAV